MFIRIVHRSCGFKAFLFYSGLIDRSLPRANTLPGDKADVDKLEPSSSQLHLERSKTERRTQKNIADEAAQIFDGKISARKKV